MFNKWKLKKLPWQLNEISLFLRTKITKTEIIFFYIYNIYVNIKTKYKKKIKTNKMTEAQTKIIKIKVNWKC